MSEKSIFERFYAEESFVDRFKEKEEEAVDVIIPILNTNELWEKNLYSFYREIPINRLLVGDGGCTDDSIEIVRKFPRVEIFKQAHLKTLGYRIQRLLEKVETEWFIYLHGDVYLPENWYDDMKKNQKAYDWFECNAKLAALIEWEEKARRKVERPYSGSQMGRTGAFKNIIPKIDDDFLYRNEDIILKELIEAEGFRYGRASDVYFYHQVMNKKGETEPDFESVTLRKEPDKKWETETFAMQVKGIIKYLKPKEYLLREVNTGIAMLLKYDAFNWQEFEQWIREVNPVWLEYVSKKKFEQWVREGVPFWMKYISKIESIRSKIFKIAKYVLNKAR